MKTILRASVVCVLFAGSAIALTGERMATIPLDKMTTAQRGVADAIMTGPRKSIGGRSMHGFAVPSLRIGCRRSAIHPVQYLAR
ncbi:MAG: hypothetical protein WDN50_02540 [Bradyrhizobium sp.]